jgi:menaquinone-dependent protoporphyrinogen oxidase
MADWAGRRLVREDGRMNILILYGTTEGQTEKIAHRMADAIRIKGHQAVTQCVNGLPSDFSLENFDAVILGGSIHMGKYQKSLKTFVAEYVDRLNSMPSAFFTVCMGIQSRHESDRQTASRYGERFIQETGWKPRKAETFSGAVKFTQYNFITRFIMKRISGREGGSTDTSRDHEYTDWEAVRRFAEQFVVEIGG